MNQRRLFDHGSCPVGVLLQPAKADPYVTGLYPRDSRMSQLLCLRLPAVVASTQLILIPI